MAKSNKSSLNPINPMRLRPFDPDKPDVIYAVVETPMGSRNKFKYDQKLGCFRLSSVLPQGMMFPYAFGFVPGTRAADGDPTDVLVIMDEPAFTGCVVPSRLIGVIEAEQSKNGSTNRNDRLIAVAAKSQDHSEVNTLDDLNSNVLNEIEHFFMNYNRQKGRKFKVLATKGPAHARKILKKALKKSNKKEK